MLYDATDTIAAITTPLGESGIGAIRSSGPDAYTLCDRSFDSQSQTP